MSELTGRVKSACYAARIPITVFTFKTFKQGQDVLIVPRVEFDNEEDVESGMKQDAAPSESEILAKHANLAKTYEELKKIALSYPGTSLHSTGRGQIAFKRKINFLYVTFQKSKLRLSVKLGKENVKRGIANGAIVGELSRGDAFVLHSIIPNEPLNEDLREDIRIAAENAK